MELNQNKIDNSLTIVKKRENLIERETFENLSYLYPNGHCTTHQIRWFKGSRDRGLKNHDTA